MPVGNQVSRNEPGITVLPSRRKSKVGLAIYVRPSSIEIVSCVLRVALSKEDQGMMTVTVVVTPPIVLVVAVSSVLVVDVTRGGN